MKSFLHLRINESNQPQIEAPSELLIVFLLSKSFRTEVLICWKDSYIKPPEENSLTLALAHHH